MRSTNILFLILLLFNVLDCVTGFVKSRYKGKENSKSGARGIVNKLGMCLLYLFPLHYLSLSVS